MLKIKPVNSILLMILSFLTSCLATSSLKRADHKISHYNREFNYQDHNDSLVKGICSGIEKIDTNEYYHLQFDNLLLGNNRLLDIYLPVQAYQAMPVIKESRTKIKKEYEVLGCVNHYFNMDEKSLKYNLFYPSSQISKEPQKELINMIQTTDKVQTVNPFIVLDLDLSNVFESKITTLVWEKDSNNEWKGTRYYCLPSRPDNWFEPKIRWKKRSILSCILIKPLYLITLTIDLVTFPFQLFILKGVVR